MEEISGQKSMFGHPRSVCFVYERPILCVHRIDRKKDKAERKILDSQERAFWDVHRPVVSCSWIMKKNMKKKNSELLFQWKIERNQKGKKLKKVRFSQKDSLSMLNPSHSTVSMWACLCWTEKYNKAVWVRHSSSCFRNQLIWPRNNPLSPATSHSRAVSTPRRWTSASAEERGTHTGWKRWAEETKLVRYCTCNANLRNFYFIISVLVLAKFSSHTKPKTDTEFMCSPYDLFIIM